MPEAVLRVLPSRRVLRRLVRVRQLRKRRKPRGPSRAVHERNPQDLHLRVRARCPPHFNFLPGGVYCFVSARGTAAVRLVPLTRHTRFAEASQPQRPETPSRSDNSTTKDTLNRPAPSFRRPCSPLLPESTRPSEHRARVPAMFRSPPPRLPAARRSSPIDTQDRARIGALRAIKRL